MRLLAMSEPAGHPMLRICGDGGVCSGLLATRITAIARRSAARNRMSLMTLGQASASTQICMVIALNPRPLQTGQPQAQAQTDAGGVADFHETDLAGALRSEERRGGGEWR